MSVHFFCLFFNQVVCCSVVELYELFIYLYVNPILIKSSVNIFSHSVGCIFILSVVYFHMM